MPAMPFRSSIDPPTASAHRVIACLGGGRTRLEIRPLPRPGPGEILLRMRVSGVCGTDLFKLASGGDAPGAVLGHEVVGEVAEVGDGVDRFQPGDRVVVPHHVPCLECALCRRGSETLCPRFRDNLLEPGGFAEHFLARPRAVALAARRLPAGLPDRAAVFLEPAACVLRGARRSGLGPEGLAAVLGAGSMGLLHIRVLRAVFPRVQVLAVESLPERRRLAVDHGAHRAAAPGPEAAAAARELSGGLGADAVFDAAGGAGALESALELTREGGTAVLFAHAPAGERAALDLNRLFKHERRVIGTYSGALREQEEIFELLVQGRLDPAPLVTHVLPLAEFDRAVDLLRRREALKVLLAPEGREEA